MVASEVRRKVTAASELIKNVVGKMMFKKLFMEFAQTTRGGRVQEEEADVKWLEYMDEIKKGQFRCPL